jgi:hypothetical protein
MLKINYVNVSIMSQLLSNKSNIEINFRKILNFNIVLFKKSYNLSINSTNTFLYLFDLECYSKITFRFLLNSNTKSSETAGLT